MHKTWSFVRLCFVSCLLTGLFSGCDSTSRNESVELDYLGSPEPGNTPQVFLPGIISYEGRFEMGFAMSPDGQTMVYGVAHESDSNQTNLYFIQKQQDNWSSSQKEPLPQNRNVFFPMFGPDGKHFYFAKAKPDGDTDLWRGEFKKGSVQNTRPLAGDVNSAYREAGHGLAHDGTFLFTSNRDQAQPYGGDVYQRNEDGSVDKVASLSSEWDEESLFLSHNGDYVIIQAWKPEFQGKHDLYISYRLINDSWSKPQRLNAKINSAEIEQRPFISPDSEFLFFSRMSIEQKEDEQLFESDVFWVSTEKVFAPYIFNPANAFEVSKNGSFTLDLPKNLFKHITQQKLDIVLNVVDGSALSEGIQFDPELLRITGKLADQKSLVLTLKATDSDGQSVSLDIELLAKEKAD